MSDTERIRTENKQLKAVLALIAWVIGFNLYGRGDRTDEQLRLTMVNLMWLADFGATGTDDESLRSWNAAFDEQYMTVAALRARFADMVDPKAVARWKAQRPKIRELLEHAKTILAQTLLEGEPHGEA